MARNIPNLQALTISSLQTQPLTNDMTCYPGKGW